MKNSFKEALLYNVQEIKRQKEEQEKIKPEKKVLFNPNVTATDKQNWLSPTKTFHIDKNDFNIEKEASQISSTKHLTLTSRYDKGNSGVFKQLNKKTSKLISPFRPEDLFLESQSFNEKRFMSVAPVLKKKYQTRNAFRVGGSLPPLFRDGSPMKVSSEQSIVDDLA